MSERLLTADEVAARLNVPVSWVRQETRAGRMPCVELGRYRRYSAADVDAWVEGLKSGNGAAYRRHRPAGVS